MYEHAIQKNNKQIAYWLLIGVAMILIQVLLGGITRLTESGLSITEWKPITGALPPLNETAWQLEFDKYRNTDQFKYVHQHFSLRDFKFIFFWEWAHRLWARLMGLVFIAGFIYFLAKRKFSKPIIAPMVILFLLGALQGAIGWVMVKSGLVPATYFVGHIELTTHLLAALILLLYCLWFALKLLPGMQLSIQVPGIRKWLLGIGMLLFIQLMYGGFMAGLRAAVTAPTWPDINGNFLPNALWSESPWYKNLVHNPITIHFIHRGIGYLLFILVILFYFKAITVKGNRKFSVFVHSFFVLIFMQVCLGISSLLFATKPDLFVWVAVLHQFTAMLVICCFTILLFLARKCKKK